jgi:hypothetical protein
MSIDFPDSPEENDVFTVDNKQWTFDGVKWVLTGSGIVGPQGPQGEPGPAGNDGGWSTAQTIKEESGTSYTIQSSDVGKLIIFTSQDPVSVTVPWSLGFSIGQRVDIFQRYNGQITVSGGAGPMPADMVFVLGTPGNKTRTALSAATLVYINYNVSGPEYALIGDLSA